MKNMKLYAMRNGLVAILLLATFVVLCLERFHAAMLVEAGDDLERSMLVLRTLIKQKGTGFRIQDGQLWVGNHLLNGDTDLPDKVREITGNGASILLGAARVSTSLQRADGSRAEGSFLEEKVARTVLQKGKPFRGETAVLGVPSLTACDPIKDSRGRVIGALSVGIKKRELYARYAVLRTELLLAGAGGMILLILQMILINRLIIKAEKERDETLRFLQTLIDFIPAPIFYNDRAGRNLGCNQAYLDYSGLSREALVGTKADEMVSPGEPGGGVDGELAQLLKNGGQSYESAVVYADGTPHQVICYKAAFPGADGSPAGMIGLMLDITDRKKIEEELWESQRKLSQIFEFFPDPTLVVDNEGVVVAWNRAIEKLTGIGAREMVGKGNYEYALPFYGQRRPMLIDLVNRPDRELERAYLDLEHRGDTLVGESCAIREGDEVYLHGTAAPLHDTCGKLIGAIEAIRDITAKKKDEAALAEKERQLSGILDAVQDGICMLDDQLTVIRVNPFFEGLFAASLPLVGRKCHEVFADSPHPCRVCPSLAAISSGEPSWKVFCDPHWGKDRWFEVVSFPVFDEQGQKVTGVVEHVRDITRRRETEEKLARLNEDLEREVQERTAQLLNAQEELVRREKLATLGQLSGIVGHELRNPLAVMNNAHYVLKNVVKDDPEAIARYLDIIKNEIDNSLCIIGDLLDFASTKTPRARSTAVPQLIEETLAKCHLPPEIELTVESGESLPVLVVDPLQIRQVLQNLVTNALQAMEAGGALHISARREGDAVEIAVADTGVGISPENMEKVFQPLFTTKPKGIGLGLVACKSLTEANGGSLEVTSELGRGTVFTVSLPVPPSGPPEIGEAKS